MFRGQPRTRFIILRVACNPTMRISVAMCTFNGAQYLQQQLDSIAKQSRLPDEVILCDDRSADATPEIVHRFAETAPFPVEFHVNEENLGSTRNFEQAIRLCSGDLIALSDQDDIWYPFRLERSEQQFLAHSEVGLVFSDADLIDENGALTGGTVWESFKFNSNIRRELIQGDYTLCLRLRFVTGATAMFRSSLREHFLPVGAGWIHDEWIAASVPLFAEILPIEQPLIQYRRHVQQQLGPAPHMSMLQRALDVDLVRKSQHWKRIDRVTKMMQALQTHFSNVALDARGEARYETYRSYQDHLVFRNGLPASRLARLRPILGHLPAYLKFDNVGRMMKDLLSHS